MFSSENTQVQPNVLGPEAHTQPEPGRKQHRVSSELGWDTMTVWQCELRDLDAALNRIVLFLGPPRRPKAPAGPQASRHSAYIVWVVFLKRRVLLQLPLSIVPAPTVAQLIAQR